MSENTTINPMKKFEPGISSWSFPWASGAASGPQPTEKLTHIQLLSKAIDLGVALVQIADNMPLELLSSEQLIELKEFAKTNHIRIEVGTKGIDYEHLYKLLEIAIFLESPVLRTIPALFGKKIGMEELEQCINKVLPRFQKEGIVLVLENTEAFFATEYAALMDRINHPNFRMCIDLANAIGRFEGPYYVMDLLSKYCANYHFKDVKITRSPSLMGFSVEGTISGQGNIPLDYAVQSLVNYGLFTSVIIELWPPLLPNLEETLLFEQQMVNESVRFMKSFLENFNEQNFLN